MHFLGFGLGVKVYSLYDPNSHKTFHSRNVTFSQYVMLSSIKDIVVSSNFDQEEDREKVEFWLRIYYEGRRSKFLNYSRRSNYNC